MAAVLGIAVIGELLDLASFFDSVTCYPPWSYGSLQTWCAAGSEDGHPFDHCYEVGVKEMTADCYGSDSNWYVWYNCTCTLPPVDCCDDETDHPLCPGPSQ